MRQGTPNDSLPSQCGDRAAISSTGYRVLWFEAPDNVETGEYGRSLGQQLGLNVDFLTIGDLEFSVDKGKMIITSNKVDIVATYDALIIRSCIPYIAEVITLGRLFYNAGKVVVDQSMVDEAVVLSKMYEYLVLSHKKIPVPDTIQLFSLSHTERFISKHNPPYIVKSIHGDFGRHVFKVNTLSEITSIYRRYKTCKLMLQEFLDSNELFKIHVIGHKALPVIAIHRSLTPDNLLVDRKCKYVEPSSSNAYDDLKTLAEECSKALRIEFCSVDIKVIGGAPYVLEANRRPGLLGFKQDTGYEAGIDLLRYVIDRIGSQRTLDN